MLSYGGGVVFGARFGAWLVAASSSAAAASPSSSPLSPSWNSTGSISDNAETAGISISSSGSGDASSVFVFAAAACALTCALTLALRRADWRQARSGQMHESNQLIAHPRAQSIDSHQIIANMSTHRWFSTTRTATQQWRICLELIAHFLPLLTHFFVSSIIDVLDEIQKICKKQLLNLTPIFHACFVDSSDHRLHRRAARWSGARPAHNWHCPRGRREWCGWSGERVWGGDDASMWECDGGVRVWGQYQHGSIESQRRLKSKGSAAVATAAEAATEAVRENEPHGSARVFVSVLGKRDRRGDQQRLLMISQFLYVHMPYRNQVQWIQNHNEHDDLDVLSGWK
jgi:hypothetical protein